VKFCVFFAVRTELLNIACTVLGFRELNTANTENQTPPLEETGRVAEWRITEICDWQKYGWGEVQAYMKCMKPVSRYFYVM
jgi:hypothetical protein